DRRDSEIAPTNLRCTIAQNQPMLSISVECVRNRKTIKSRFEKQEVKQLLDTFERAFVIILLPAPTYLSPRWGLCVLGIAVTIHLPPLRG
ncbi:MAG: hypothetical protein OXT74_00810, partial [Candidatus Poribacteria bacterium]|nr:hypothetical protein [Candidatus Poribacteria bacterium]